MTKNHLRLFAGSATILLACGYGYHEMTKPVFGCLLKKSAPLAMATSLESAVNNFFTEYGTLPDTGDHVTTVNAKLLFILLGYEDPSEKIQNLRNVRFLSVKEGKNRRGGLIYNADGKPEGLFDPWGSPYTVELDTDNDETLRFKPRRSS